MLLWVRAPILLHLHADCLTASLSWGHAGHVAGCWAGGGTAVGFGRLDSTAVGFVAMPCSMITPGSSCRPAIAQVTSLALLGFTSYPNEAITFSLTSAPSVHTV